MSFSRLISRSVYLNRVGSRSLFTVTKPDFTNPNWSRVALTFGSTVFIWVLLFKQHSRYVEEYEAYKRSKGLE